ncbi:AI-2E family transporter [Frigoribacterium faeni]|uniref:AI-2E family transporter n=1 Tax=Frigoribacterium faeni TaxID=145483 RepID=A0A7W3JGJ5_9MICO|nr:AI-2E family transporter [Frigoribacterium faeni]MBA8812451.1 putative PurR-regulated permease PerM [Frigoribacterium faeni]BFF13529.1 AI-2E family transporter [Microbacterium flavescens]GEK81832.1 AI-2E family transporter [Frigoribacterium faeni]
MKIHNPFRLGLLAGLGVLVALVIGGAVSELSTIITYVGAAIFISLGLDPVVTWLERRRVPRSLAIVIVMTAVLGAVVGVVFAIVPVIVSQATALITNLVTYLQSVTTQQFVDNLQELVPQNVFDVQQGLDSVVSFLSDPDNVVTIGGGVLAVGVAIGNGLFATVIVLILTLYFTSSITVFKRGLYQLVPASKRLRFVGIAEQISESVGRYVIGQFTLAAINGILSFVFLSIIGAEQPAVFAFIAFLGSIIPLVGTISGSAVIVLAQVALLPQSPATWITAAIWYLLYMQVEAYLLSPRIMRRAVKVPGVIVVIAALVGGTLLGVLGALIAIPVAASVLLIIREVVVPRQNEL